MSPRNAPFLITACVLCLALPGHSGALDSVELQLVGQENDDLRQSLRDATILSGLVENAEAEPGDIVSAARADYSRIVEALYAQGYYSVAVEILLDGREAARIDPFDEPSRITKAQIRVTPGRRFSFGKVRIAPLAKPGPPVEGFLSGAPARSTVLRAATQTAVEDWRDAGHAKVRIADQSVLARHGAAQLDADVKLAPGRRAVFGDVSVSGESAVRGSRVRQIAGIPQGAVFSPSEVERAAARLRKTGTFKSVQITEAERIGDDGTLDMGIAVVDRKPRRIGGGLEYSNFDGITLSGFWLHRNILGGAERLRVDGEIAQLGGAGDGVDYSLSFRFEKPAVYGADTLFFAEAGAYYIDEPDYLQEKVEFVAGVSKAFSEKLTGSLGLGYSFSRVTDRYVTPNTTRELRLISLPLSLTYDTRDTPLDARKGLYLNAEFTPFLETGQQQAGGHLSFDGRAYRALGEGNAPVLAGRLQLGVLAGPSAQSAPPDFLFYSGGGGTVRGQPYNSLGADYGGGVTLGGRSFAGLSGELRYPVSSSIGLVAFADAGFVGSDVFDNGDWHAGAGLGLRYKTPVGPIRLDVAGPVAGDTGDGVQIYVGIGQAF